MEAHSPISRQHLSFAVAGVVFGLVLGFILAHQLYGGRQGGVVSAGAPETMGGARGAVPMGGEGGQASSPASDMGQMEQVRRELEALRKALQENPRDVAALSRMGNLYMDAGMCDRAVEYYGQLLELEPANVDVRTDMGSCLRQMGRPAEALKAFEESVTRDPNHWKSWFNIGVVCLYDTGDYTRAEGAFERVLTLNPGSFDMQAVRSEIQKLKAQKAGAAAGASPS